MIFKIKLSGVVELQQVGPFCTLNFVKRYFHGCDMAKIWFCCGREFNRGATRSGANAVLLNQKETDRE